jgi:hypothetical protein
MTPDQQLDAMLDRFTPEVAAVAREAIAAMIARFPGALRLVYDNYNALAIGFGPNETTRAIVLSIALYPRWASLFLANGPSLPDPEGLLEGEGGTVRHVKLSPGRIAEPAVRALIDAAAESVAVPIDPAGEGRTIIKSISAKQRPRRPKA